MIGQAAFSFKGFHFDKVKMDFSVLQGNDLRLDIEPQGTFYSEDKTFELFFRFSAIAVGQDESETGQNVLEVNCVSSFEFKNVETVEDIPDYFFANSLAIVFPYVRAFVSNITLQANIRPLVLPTLNLSGLQDQLRNNMTVK